LAATALNVKHEYLERVAGILVVATSEERRLAVLVHYGPMPELEPYPKIHSKNSEED
jgi:hypothetical protein